MKENQISQIENLRAYRIIRFRKSGGHRTIKTGLTLAEAQEWCSRDATKKEGIYFDGYDLMKGISAAED